MIELNHSFTTDKPVADSWALLLNLERLVPCVQGGKVKEPVCDTEVNAVIRVKMGGDVYTLRER